MTAYVRGASRPSIEAARARQQAVMNEALQAEAILAAIRKAEAEIERTARRRDKALTALLEVRDRFKAEADTATAELDAMKQARADIAVHARTVEATTNRLQRELRQAEDTEVDLHRLQRERLRTAAKLRAKTASNVALVNELARQNSLPEPIHGGPAGLEAAAREAKARRAAA